MTIPDTRKPDTGEMLEIDIVVRDTHWETLSGDVHELCRQSACAAFSAGVSKPLLAEAALVLADDEFVAGLNLQYRNRQGATNVLSFAACDADDPATPIVTDAPTMLGDIIVARETTVREADEVGISVEHHLRHLVVHGMLHLLGYDHITDDEAAEMEPLETGILAAMGVADPYADVSRPSEGTPS